jgi:hypothetical protein
MSANNVWIVKEHKGKFYGWDEMAEENMDDAQDGYRLLNYASAMVEEDSMDAAVKKLEERGYLGYAEYGVDTSGRLPKDGTPIKFVE